MTHLRVSAMIALVALVLIAAGCGQRLRRMLQPNRPPTVRLAPPRIVESRADGRTYALRWVADDPDGQVRAYLVAMDPVSPDVIDAGWERTTTPERIVTLDGSRTPQEGFHRFVVRAIDDRGSLSDPAWLALAADNIPPTVQITCPHPSRTFVNLVPPTITITWTGIDPDGVVTTAPVEYRFLVLTAGSEFSIDVALANPDSLRNYYANHPSGPWSGWISTAESASVRFSNLLLGQRYLFVVIAFDEQGAYSPMFSRDSNMLYMNVGFPGGLGPRITMIGPGLFYMYPGPGYADDAAHHIPVEVVSDHPVTLQWYAALAPGSCGVRYRWVLDPASLDDPTPRTDPSDVHHWSDWSEFTTSATVGPLGAPLPPKRLVHTLYIEAEDVYGRSLGILDLVVVPPTFSKDLLIVDDTRRRPDNFLPDGSLIPPQGTWPGAAELDTFLFARGGAPWRLYPPGTLTEPGLFAGYSFDTMGTRYGTDRSIPLSTLCQYRCVVWYVDLTSAGFGNPPNVPNDPITVLRSISRPGQRVPLATYVAMGGHLWLAGSGAAYANLISYNRSNNDAGGRYVFSSTLSPPELMPGQFMYDAALWRSEIWSLAASTSVQCSRFTGRYEGTGTYITVPSVLESKAPATDPLPPLRTAQSFYLTTKSIEVIARPNEVLDAGVSALDTLMSATGSGIPAGAVAMTCSPGGNPQLVFSGFDFWSWKRSQCVQLVDFVLHDLWGLTRQQPAATAAVAHRPSRR